jgi:DNA-binding NarL/FixJ family response regulator
MTEPGHHILIADDHPVFRDALRNIVETLVPGLTVSEANSFDSVNVVVTQHPDLDLVLLDLNMPGMNGFGGIISLRNTAPAIPVIVVTAEERESSMRQSESCGASGFILKSMPREVMADAIRRVMNGETFFPYESAMPRNGEVPADDHDDELSELKGKIAGLTDKQKRVLDMVALGMTNKVIAYELKVTESTVKAHVSAILKQLNVYNRSQVVLLMNKLGD